MTLKHPNTWITDHEYSVGDTVWVYNERFTCVIGHKSKTFGNEYFNDKVWIRDNEISES